MDFLSFAQSHGLEIEYLNTGKISRCRTSGHRSKKNGAYYFEGDFGWCMDWSAHEKPVIWTSDKQINPQELQRKIKKSQEKYTQDRARINQQAIKKAQAMLSQCRNDISAYLASKGFPETCFNMLFVDNEDPLLCVPMRINGNLSGLQQIKPCGEKKFIYGTNPKLATFDIGSGNNVFLAEGLATALSMQKIAALLKIPYTIRVCFSAGNMANVAKLHGDPVLICDNDLSGTGQKVGADSGKRFYLPSISGYDLNDECNKLGYFVVAQKIKNILYKKLNRV